MEAKEKIARRIAKEFQDGNLINLGIGLPTLASQYVPEGVSIRLQTENGFAGSWSIAKPKWIEGREVFDADYVDAGGRPIAVEKGGVTFDSVNSFAAIRGGRIDLSVLGALQVDEKGDLANWKIPGKLLPGMGGAMDLVNGSKKVIAAMLHTAKGQPKILRQCDLPLTGRGVVDLIVTELAVFEFAESKLTLTEKAEDASLENLKKLTPARYEISPGLKPLTF